MKQQSVSSILCGVFIGLLIFGAIFASLSTELAYAQLSGATAAYQQQQQLQRYQSSPASPSSMPESSTLFESLKKGIRIQVPTGYVVEDPALPSQDIQKIFQLSGFSYIMPQFLLSICPEELALPATGGQYECQNPKGIVYGPRQGAGTIGSADAIHVMRFNNLHDNPEFESAVPQNKSITADDLVAFNIKFLSQGRDIDLNVTKTTDTTVNYYPKGPSNSTTTNQAPIALPAKLADFTYTANSNNAGVSIGSTQYRGFFLHVVGPDGNTGYVLAYEQPSEDVKSGKVQWLSPAVAQVFDSFELVEPVERTATS
ncbi:MAG: hypothetical protein ACJ707_10230 [Nitrososphaera sp.]